MTDEEIVRVFIASSQMCDLGEQAKAIDAFARITTELARKDAALREGVEGANMFFRYGTTGKLTEARESMLVALGPALSEPKQEGGVMTLEQAVRAAWIDAEHVLADEGDHIKEFLAPLKASGFEVVELPKPTPKERAIAARAHEPTYTCGKCHVTSYNVQPWCGRGECPGRAMLAASEEPRNG